MEKVLEDLELHKEEAESSIKNSRKVWLLTRHTAEEIQLGDQDKRRESRTSKEFYHTIRRGACNLHSRLD
jgi:hypothetical protein